MSRTFLLLFLLQVLISACNNVASQNIKNVGTETLLLISCLICALCVCVCIFCLLRIKNLFNHGDISDSYNEHNTTNSGMYVYKKNIETIEAINGYKGLVNRVILLEGEVKKMKMKLEKHNDDTKARHSNYGNTKNFSFGNENKQKTTDQAKKQSVKKAVEIIPKPNNSQYLYLKVVDGGRLANAQNEDNAYYRAWTYNGILYFEFSASKVMKAINNRTSVIEPFCDIINGTVEPDNASVVNVKAYGKLNMDYTIIEKVKIEYGTK